MAEIVGTDSLKKQNKTKQKTSVLLQETPFKFENTHKFKIKIWKKIHPTNSRQKKVILISG